MIIFTPTLVKLNEQINSYIAGRVIKDPFRAWVPKNQKYKANEELI